MNFDDLLNKDGQGSRRLDAWLYRDIAGNHLQNIYNNIDSELSFTEHELTDEAYWIPNYTTGDSIDPIWELAKGYFNSDIALTRGDDGWRLVVGSDYYSCFEVNALGVGFRNYQQTEQLAIAEAFVKAYQKEEN